MTRLHNKLLVDAGERYVAFQLARRGVSPALLSTNTQGADLLGTINGRRAISIQVKTSAGRNNPRAWAIGKNKPKASETFFYFFVNIWDDDDRVPECFVVPSYYVEQSVSWDASMPQFRFRDGEEIQFREDWESLVNALS